MIEETIKEETGYVFVQEWEGICAVVVIPKYNLLSIATGPDEDYKKGVVTSGRILLFVATGPDHTSHNNGHMGYKDRIESIKKALNKHSAARGWYWQKRSKPEVGIYVSIPSPHESEETPVDFLRRVTGFTIKEKDEHPHLHLFHD